jgi:SAM-dependent methyltransferase
MGIPWQLRLGAKIALSRLPSSYYLWQRLGLFRHGFMEQPAYAYGVFRAHYDRSAFGNKGEDFVALELGPGDSLFSALTARAFGARAIYLVDTGEYARNDLPPYLSMLAYLEGQGLAVGNLYAASSLGELLGRCQTTYGTEGIASLRKIPSASVDFVWSHAVLEHIKRDEFASTMAELRRVIGPSGVCSHRIDLMDHLGGALNNLRFSRRVWESSFMTRSGFYTNRLRLSDMTSFFEEAGFRTSVLKVERWDTLPTSRRRMSAEFRVLPEEELRVSAFDVLLTPK